MKKAALLIMTSILAQTATADLSKDLLGQWKLSSATCTDGSPALKSPEGFDMGFDVTIVFGEKEANSIVNLSWKMKPETEKKYMEQIEAGRRAAEMLPDGEAKEKYLSELANSEAQIKAAAAGVQCSSREQLGYVLSGSIVKSTTLSAENNCPGGKTAQVGTESESEVVVVGAKLTMKSLEAEKEEGKSCPKGQFTTLELVRVQN